MRDVDAPSAAMLCGVAVVVILFTTAVWLMLVVPLLPSDASVAVIVQLPTVVEALYVTVAVPPAPVVAGLPVIVPQAAPLPVKLTGSAGTGPPLEFLTVAVTLDVVVPSAGTLVGLAATVTELAAALVWVMVVVPLPVEASVAV